MTAIILPFRAIRASDLPLVGGKGANLGEMTHAGFPVPPGFCITTAAFRQFMQASGQAEEIYCSLEKLAADEVEGVRRVGQEVRAQLAQVPLPAAIADAIVAAWEEVRTDDAGTDAFAVRSSATAEDLPGASFAGQQDTYLNIVGKQALLERVRACWISLFTDRAILYRAQNGFSHRDVYLAVVVQRMVSPELSGILFTADPVSGHRQIVSIDASYGLGEALVAGLVSADLYKVDKRSHAIVEIRTGDKQLAIRPQAGGGTYQERLEGQARHARVLSDAQVLALADLGVRIEAHYGKPQDIEWCIAQGEIYVVQARPITSLFPVPEPASQDGTLHVFFSFSHMQVMTDPMPLMGIDFLRLVFPFGKGKDPLVANPYLTPAAGRLYVDLTSLLRVPLLGRGLPNFLRIADVLSAGALREVVERAEFTQAGSRGHARFSTIARWLLPVFAKGQAVLWWLPPEGVAERLLVGIDAYIESARAQLAAVPAGAPRLRLAQRMMAMVFADKAMAMPPYMMGGMGGKLLLGRVMRRVGDPAQVTDDVEAIGRGLFGNVTTEMDLMVGDMADAARQSPALVQHLSEGDAREALATAHTIEGSAAFLAAWDKFIQRYGMRGPSEIDISRPGWAEEPASLLQVVIANLQHAQPGAHRVKHAQLAAARKVAGARLVETARQGAWGVVRAPLVRRLVRVAQALLPVREHPKYLIIRMRGLAREVILECAALLQEQGRIDEVGDVWFLTWHELATALEEPRQEVRERIRSRQQTYMRFWQMVPPRVITSDGEIPSVSHDHAALPAGALAGSPVSAGIVEGRAKVILDPQRELLSPGEILIAPFTDPGWTPLFINAAGLVMEVGGLMTHGSVVAREYGIPAVVSVIDATKKIHTGQQIRVNGSAGYVEILDGERDTAGAEAAGG
ncbi:MAG: phosphoenolpyruvate synthase [Caldilineaceae bacterium]|nr:phosphoenolpyruvate synthase [Caldilineaceae bacterium]